MSLTHSDEPTLGTASYPGPYDSTTSAAIVRWPEPSPLQGWWDEIMSPAGRKLPRADQPG